MNRIKFIRPSDDVVWISLYRSKDINLDYTRIIYRSAFDSDGNYISELVDPDGEPDHWYIIGFIDAAGNESFSEPQRYVRKSFLDSVRELGSLTPDEISDANLQLIIQSNIDKVIHRITSVAYDEPLSYDSKNELFYTEKQPILDRQLDGYFSSQDVQFYYRQKELDQRMPIPLVSGSSQGFFKLSGSFGPNDLITGDWLYLKNPSRLDYNLIREAIILGSVADAFSQMVSGLSGTALTRFKFAESIRVGKVSKKSGAGSKDIWGLIENYKTQQEKIISELLMSGFRRFRTPSTKRRSYSITVKT
ncbi:MAG TPA: hypothetical protein EYP30_03895 [Archaeoglobaceae archaeon]|nr:hypothetical protein [Archaeoglobaceae archaeon]